jgi:hypothetical protein
MAGNWRRMQMVTGYFTLSDIRISVAGHETTYVRLSVEMRRMLR